MFWRIVTIGLLACVCCTTLGGPAQAFADTTQSPPSQIRKHTVKSQYQEDPQEIHVLVPDDYDAAKKYRVLYVLPVEPGFQKRYGYGIGTFEIMDVHNKYDLVVVQPGFAGSPWLGDHATDPKMRQASHFKQFVVPYIEKHYSTPGSAEGRLLFGFSKSGWAAIGLTLKYPDYFGYAASWDAPLMFDRFHLQMQDVYGTQDQLNEYRPDLLVVKNKHHFQDQMRLVISGEMGWGKSRPAPGGGSHTVEFHELLNQHGIKHHYDNSLKVPHRWDARWMGPTLTALLELAKT
jgi:enterochelin esterase-like enzyme